MKRLFLSYSVSGDADGRDFVRQLFARLEQQGIEPWVYESPRGAIESGRSIADACRRKIEEADIFVVFVNDRALGSDYVVMEVAHALWEGNRRPLPIIPLIATRRLPDSWPVAMAEAADFKGVLLPLRALEALESVVTMICGRLQIAYRPPKAAAVRLPLRQRVAEELQGHKSLSAFDAGDFGAVLQKCDLATDAMGQEDYVKAGRLLQSLLTDLELQYELPEPYYPRIVFGAVMMADAHAGRRSFDSVERYFASLIAEASERLDANAFVGRANALMALGRFEEALAAYVAAEPYLESPDAALFYNMVRARVLGRLGLDREEIRRRQAALGNGIVTRVPGDLARLMSSICLAYAYVGQIDAAHRAWLDVGDLNAVFPEIVIDICDQLERASADRQRSSLHVALAIVTQYSGSRSDLPPDKLLALKHFSARLRFSIGERVEARRELTRLLGEFPHAPVLRLDAAMFALEEGDAASARRMCETVVSLVDPSQCHPPVSAADFNYALGHAFWLLGKKPEAQESFRRSAYGASLWYGDTMSREFAAAG